MGFRACKIQQLNPSAELTVIAGLYPAGGYIDSHSKRKAYKGTCTMSATQLMPRQECDRQVYAQGVATWQMAFGTDNCNGSKWALGKKGRR